MSNSLWSHGLQHARLPCPPLSPGVCSNSLSRWCSLTSPSSAAPSSFYRQSFPASESFPMTQLFTSDGQGIGASASVLLMNIQVRIPLELTGLISLLSRELSRVFSSTTIQNHQFFSTQPSSWANLTSIHDYWKNQFTFHQMDIPVVLGPSVEKIMLSL